MTPGKLLYQLYHKPIGAIRKTLKTGIRRTAETNRGRMAMIEASTTLREVRYDIDETLNVYFLTGKQYWFQTAFCLYSLQVNAGTNIHAYVVDDGSFDEELEQQVQIQFPTTVTLIRNKQLLELLYQKLPQDIYPVLRKRRIEYPHLRKLTDVHILPGDGPKLVLDSDMLFFHQPGELLAWLRNPEGMLFMRDVEESYGYTNDIMLRLTSAQSIPERLNVGVAGIRSNEIPWKELEHWTDSLLQKEGSSYLQEQALTAMIAARGKYRFLDDHAYKVLPSIGASEVQEILHHYVADSKYDYFVKGWRFFVTPEHQH